MARKNRNWIQGGMYHITTRGIRRSLLFHDDKDREMYLFLLILAKKRFNFVVHSYCLMPNHVHLQLEMSTCSPPQIMQYINSVYANYFNEKYNYTGHVFDRRYSAFHVGTKSYELDLSRYIHLNPIRAGIAIKTEEYPWSSCRAYTSSLMDDLVNTSRLLSYFKEPQRDNYLRFLITPTLKHALLKRNIPS
ncbi:transposase [Bacillus sp. FJAT-27445]|uniref:transposase n=1 Tax=Bacillus sp. FJAT-27445 TaxID=1679166 RepID=UPI000743423E|nr:transposase [Bacillus sp. FJAT-27445]